MPEDKLYDIRAARTGKKNETCSMVLHDSTKGTVRRFGDSKAKGEGRS